MNVNYHDVLAGPNKLTLGHFVLPLKFPVYHLSPALTIKLSQNLNEQYLMRSLYIINRIYIII